MRLLFAEKKTIKILTHSNWSLQEFKQNAELQQWLEIE